MCWATKFCSYFVSKELGMGIEPSKLGVKTRVFGEWRYRRYSFFVASFPFFVKELCCRIQNLAGDKKHEPKIRSRRNGKRTNTKIKAVNRKTREMSTVRQHTFLERWSQRRTLRTNTTLLMQRMRLPIFKLVRLENSIFSFLFLINIFGNFSRRNNFENLQ